MFFIAISFEIPCPIITVLFNPKNNEYDHIVDPEKSNVIRKKGSLYIRIVYQNPPSFDETTIEKKFSLNL